MDVFTTQLYKHDAEVRFKQTVELVQFMLDQVKEKDDLRENSPPKHPFVLCGDVGLDAKTSAGVAAYKKLYGLLKANFGTVYDL